MIVGEEDIRAEVAKPVGVIRLVVRTKPVFVSPLER